MRYRPASYYLDRKEVALDKAHQKDANQLAYVAYALNKENLTLMAEHSETKERAKQVEQRVRANESMIANYSSELFSMVGMAYPLSGEALVNTMVLNQTVRRDDSLYQHLVPLFLRKAQYMSIGNLTEAIEVLLANDTLDSKTQDTLLNCALEELSLRKFSFQPVVLDSKYPP